ncbi:MAG: ABATE domain-containing protein [Actinomycetota bacterium]
MAESRPAPGNLETIRAFVNTLDIEDGTDDLATPGQLAEWLSAHGLMGKRDAARPRDLATAIDLREALRGMLRANNGEPADPADTDVLDEAASGARFSLTFDAGGRAKLEPAAKGAAGALGRIVSSVADAMADGSWARMKACSNDGCEWAFYDYARNHSRRWCEMAVCGNRMKARAYRTRHSGTFA